MTTQTPLRGNHLLALGGGPPSVVSQLFPTPGTALRPALVSSSFEPVPSGPPSFGLGQGLVRKAGASFGKQLGPSTPADRIIHAIDDLRKAQDENKTGTKGQVSWIMASTPEHGSLSRRIRQGSKEPVSPAFSQLRGAGLRGPLSIAPGSSMSGPCRVNCSISSVKCVIAPTSVLDWAQ